MNVRLCPDTITEAKKVAAELGQELGVFVERAILSHIVNVRAAQRFAEKKVGKR